MPIKKSCTDPVVKASTNSLADSVKSPKSSKKASTKTSPSLNNLADSVKSPKCNKKASTKTIPSLNKLKVSPPIQRSGFLASSSKDSLVPEGSKKVTTKTSPPTYHSLSNKGVKKPAKVKSFRKNAPPLKTYFELPRSPTNPNSSLFGHQRTPSMEFQELTKRDAQISLAQELDKLLKTGNLPQAQAQLIDKEFDGFKNLFAKFISAEAAAGVQWDKIEKLPEEAIKPHSSLEAPDKAAIKEMLDQLVVVKLNGGLGTSMGCKGPKSVIPVRNDLTFLDLTVQQIEYLNKKYDADVPLVLMNSFNTDEETHKIIRKYSGFRVQILTFNQSRYPRIHKESLMPIANDIKTEKNIEAWYPPGHGDFYQSFFNSGLIKDLVDQGKKFCFMSNIDNMGATVDLNILNLCLNENHEFVMEVTDKTRADVKGGTLIQYEGKLSLLEVAQVPKNHIEDFKSVKKFKIFNTNNLWISLPAIKRVIEEKTLDMEVIVNPKTLDGGINVIQLETAVGAAMKCFENGIGINVDRSRFLPVKKTSDLLLIMSNLYSLNNGYLIMSPERMFVTTPLIKLGDDNFKKVQDFQKRFSTIPDILELDHLTVQGNVTFGRSVSCKGTVIIIANYGEQIDIPDGAILENKIVSGNLRIMDH